MKNDITFRLFGRNALFTDPLTRIGGEKYSYHIPTYESIKGVLKSIYWKPTFIWVVDRLRIMRPIRTQTKSTKPLNYSGGNSLAIYTFLVDVEYQVQAHFEWNEHRPELEKDRVDGKHFSIAKRMLERGGRQDIFLGTRDCQGYVEPCGFGDGQGVYDGLDELSFGLMFHGFDYPDETGGDKLYSRFWSPIMKRGVIDFWKPEQCSVRKEIRTMKPKTFEEVSNLKSVEDDWRELDTETV
ncbi:type I-C CRISPR-associated protein Cas5c [Desulfocurvibacter africanus]|uniref:type I-C CRISPR-associated protein Cas5c n=1 Tax=Desulfocurvibacter africanus TaxID=873 RepID=UPI002FDA86AA